jgi:putative ABC transport system permease protein
MRGLLYDIRQAVRGLRARPGFTISVLLTLAVGIGAGTAMFSVLDTVLLAPLPQRNADRVVRLYQPTPQSETTGLSPLEIRDFREQSSALEDVVEYHSMPFTFVGARDAERLQTGVVSASFFQALGVTPVMGRLFRPREDQPGADPVVLLSWTYWQRAHGGDPGVIGTGLRMNDRIHTIIGVLPPLPQYPDENDVYMPTSSCPFRAGPGWAENRQARGTALALVRVGTSHDALMTELRTISARLQAQYPEAYDADRSFGIAAVPLPELIARPARTTVLLLSGATGLLLLIMCSNVGNLLIVRLLRRDAEIAVRTAFGASRSRIKRLLATEAVVLALAGGAIGLLLARASTDLLAAFAARFTPRAAEIGVDGRVIAFAVVVSFVTALLAALLPASTLRTSAATALRGSDRTSTGGAHTRVRDTLLVVQVAVSLVLLAGAGMLIRSVTHLQAVDAGINARDVLTARLDLNWTRYDSPETRRQFFHALERELQGQPGIHALGVGSTFPLNGDAAMNVSFAIEDRSVVGEEAPAVGAMTASAGYFEALGVPLLRGRTFTIDDEAQDAEPVGIITRSLAEQYWPGQDPIGRRISFNGGASWGRVVGVVGDVRLTLDGDYHDLVFVPHYRNGGIGARVLVRGAGGPLALERALRSAVAAIDPQQPLTDVVSLEAHRGDRLAPHRLTALLMTLFAGVAMLVTAVGLAGVIAFSVAQRTREIGIRVAIGAQPASVLRTVAGQTLALAGLGTLIGLIVAWPLVRALSDVAVGAPPADPLPLAGAAIVQVGTALVAGLLPARRAVRIDPLHALRSH